jgi:prepilin peptidase CpaA
MEMPWVRLLSLAPLLVLLCIAAGIDLRERRIPNWLTLMTALTGLFHGMLGPSELSVTDSMLGALCGGGLLLILFAINAIGGGDVKLMAGAGAWLGSERVFHVFLAATVIGMVIVLVQSAAQGRLRALIRNSLLVVLNAANTDSLGAETAAAMSESCQTADRPLPYAIPMLIGTLFVALIYWTNG